MARTVGRLGLLAAVAAGLLAACGDGTSPTTRGVVRLSTTADLRGAGILDALLGAFRRETGIDVRVFESTDRGALAVGERGDADVVVVADRAAEDAFVAAGHGEARADVFVQRDAAGRAPGRTYGALLVKRVPGASASVEPARRFHAWLLGDRARDVVRAFRRGGERPFLVPGESP